MGEEEERRDYALGAEERSVGEEEADPLGHAARAASHTPPPLPRLAIPPSLPWEPGPGRGVRVWRRQIRGVQGGEGGPGGE